MKSLFNAESGCNFDLDADLDLSGDWSIGVVVGPSGSGKTSIGRQIFGEPAPFWIPEWPADKPIIDAIAPEGDFNAVTGALGSVGLGSVPTWLRPYPVLSNGEKFRADLARLVCDAPDVAVVDEFMRRLKGKKVVLLTPHYDVVEWLEPDWVFDTAKRSFARGLLRRPQFDLEIWKTDGSLWPLFEPHHYLKLPRMVGAAYYVGTVDGELAVHLAVSSMNKGGGVEARACRLVTMPEWQGAGVGFRFLNEICAMQERGDENARLAGRKTTTIFHTSHPQLCQALRRDKRWRQLSAAMVGANKKKSTASIRKSHSKSGGNIGTGTGYGGHFRAVCPPPTGSGTTPTVPPTGPGTTPTARVPTAPSRIGIAPDMCRQVLRPTTFIRDQGGTCTLRTYSSIVVLGPEKCERFGGHTQGVYLRGVTRENALPNCSAGERGYAFSWRQECAENPEPKQPADRNKISLADERECR